MDIDDIWVLDSAQNFNFVLQQRVTWLSLRARLLHNFGSILHLGLFADGETYFAKAALANDVTKCVQTFNAVDFFEASKLFSGRA